MPFVDIVAKDDYASLWYWANSPNNNVGLFDPDKPTIVMLHPIGLDSSWMQRQAEDPRLFLSYNIIMFDTRLAGQSQCRFNGKYDLWVSAADLAHAFYHLRLPPSHLFAPDHQAHAILRFATLFPSLCLSLSLCNTSPPSESTVAQSSIDELNQLWGYAQDIETYEWACKEFLDFFGGPHAHPDLQDEVVAYWESYFPPFRRVHSTAVMQVMATRAGMTQKELAAVSVPVLMIQAEQSTRCPIQLAEQLQRDLVNVPGGANLFRVKATAGYLSVVCASIVNQVLSKFLYRLPEPEKSSRPALYKASLQDFMSVGLARLAELRDDPSILKRDPRSPLSFSCATPEAIKIVSQSIEKAGIGQRKAFSPLGPDGRPLRKFSERRDHWLDAGRDGFSRSEAPRRVADPDLNPKKRPKHVDKKGQLPENGGRVTPPTPPPSDEPVGQGPETYQVVRKRKGNGFNPANVDKQTVKGTMAKVVVSSPSLRMIL